MEAGVNKVLLVASIMEIPIRFILCMYVKARGDECIRTKRFGSKIIRRKAKRATGRCLQHHPEKTKHLVVHLKKV